MKKVLLWLAIVIIIALAVLWYVGILPKLFNSISQNNNRGESVVSDEFINENEAVNNQAQPEVRQTEEFTLVASNFKYDLTEIRVKQGSIVKINLNVTEGLHDWVVDEFNARTEQIAPGQSDVVSFAADKAGEFEFYCSVGSHRQQGMVGRLIVEK